MLICKEISAKVICKGHFIHKRKTEHFLSIYKLTNIVAKNTETSTNGLKGYSFKVQLTNSNAKSLKVILKKSLITFKTC